MTFVLPLIINLGLLMHGISNKRVLWIMCSFTLAESIGSFQIEQFPFDIVRIFPFDVIYKLPVFWGFFLPLSQHNTYTRWFLFHTLVSFTFIYIYIYIYIYYYWSNNKSLSNMKILNLLEHREDFWILKLQTLSPQDLNISLNYPHYWVDTTECIW